MVTISLFQELESINIALASGYITPDDHVKMFKEAVDAHSGKSAHEAKYKSVLADLIGAPIPE
tara:strand:+ start:49 stop:237 length:189 start_codon:yes stop_codon:yes gene_type:complete